MRSATAGWIPGATATRCCAVSALGGGRVSPLRHALNTAGYMHSGCVVLPRRRFPTKYIGTRNEGELNRLLLATVMVRRLKKDVLKHLPAKIRQQVWPFATSCMDWVQRVDQGSGNTR